MGKNPHKIKRLLKLPQKYSFFLFGPRQVGKSTMLRSSFSDEYTLYYNLLKFNEFTRLSENPSSFREEVLARNSNISHVVVDEVQKIPVLLDEIHYIIEESDNPPVFCLSGSSARKLKRGQANMLGGRALTLSLYPLTIRELEDNFNLDRAINLGLLPAVYLDEDVEHAKDTLMSYVNTYLEEEIKAEAIVRNIGTFTRFLKLAAQESGNILNFTNIARDTKTSLYSIKEYFRILEDTLIGFFLLPYAKSQRKKLIKHPKFYFFDTGVQRALDKKLSIEISRGSTEYGHAFENFFITQVMYLSKYAKKDYEFSFYRTRSEVEVDLIVEAPNGETFAIEIKAADENIRSKDLAGLRSFGEIKPEAKLICASLAPRKRKIKDITVYPWQEVFGILGL